MKLKSGLFQLESPWYRIMALVGIGSKVSTEFRWAGMSLRRPP